MILKKRHVYLPFSVLQMQWKNEMWYRFKLAVLFFTETEEEIKENIENYKKNRLVEFSKTLYY